jgi:molybdopterin-guanine dinucleotide biosynthesis protein A
VPLIDGFVLAGGRSRRMGFDKARAPWKGAEPSPAKWTVVPLALAAAASLEPVCGRVALVRRADDGLPWPLPDGRQAEVVWERVEAEEHPLWGVATALRAAQTDPVAILACDVPGVTAASWQALVAAAPAVAWDGERVHPLVAVVPRSLAARAEELARAGAPAHRLCEGLARVRLPPEELQDHDDPASLGEGTVARLLRSVPVTDPAKRDRIAEGERGRLAQRGILDPG